MDFSPEIGFQSPGSENVVNEYEEESPSLKPLFSKEWLTDPPQTYTGELLHNNIHGHGFYSIEKKNKVFYDGLFYANKLEGYSQIFYDDGSHYQGLFKDNRRFGPGIFTYPNGEQDVGLWNGFSLATLVIEMEGKIVPKLANTTAGKLKLLKYRNLVPVCPERKNIAFDTLENLGANEDILEDAYRLYNLDVENKHNLFFNRKLYDEVFHHNHDCIIDILLTDDELHEQDNINGEEEDDINVNNCVQDLERIKQISERLTIINSKLGTLNRAKANLFAKLQYCKKCCHVETEIKQEDSTTDAISNVALGFAQEKRLSGLLVDQSISDYESHSSSSIDYSTFQYRASLAKPQAPVPAIETIIEESYISVNNYLYGICACGEEEDIGDLNTMEEQLERVTKDVIFYETIQKNLQEKLDAHVKKSQETGTTLKTKKVLVNDLLAWNNEELSMSMLKHSFLHRRKEYMVTFQVSNVLIGNRTEFASSGKHERDCVEFLQECCKNNTQALIEKIRQNKINVNVCDSAGNSGIFFAVANCRINIISLLVNLGAKPDQLNGEGLTPISLCLLRYLALEYNLSDWEKSFIPSTSLPPSEENEVRRWYPNKSLQSMSRHSENVSVAESVTNATNRTKSVKKLSMVEATKGESYLFDTSFPIYVEPKKKTGKPHGSTDRKSKVQDTIIFPEIPRDDDINRLQIQYTLRILLECGADPNFGEVPLPPLLLAVFTRNSELVMGLLEWRANPNIRTDEKLTPLHIIASLNSIPENLKIARVLLKYYCDPNLKCSSNHWQTQTLKLVGKNMKLTDFDDFEKNPLHLLCMRRDFPLDNCMYFETLASMLIEYHINVNDRFLGHTPLSLAVLVGNKSLVQRLLECPQVDPYRMLGYNMGNILTLFILKRYEDVLPLEKSKDMLKLLVDSLVNPLKSIAEFENTIEFMEKEHEVIKEKNKKKKKGKDKGGKSSKGSKSAKKDKKKGKKGSKKGSKKSKVKSQNVLKEYLKELTRDTIIKFVQMEAVENLYNFVEENMLEYDCVKVLAEFLTPAIALENLEALFRHKRIKAGRFDKDICLKLIEFVDKYKRIVKTKKGKKGKGSKKGSKSSKHSKASKKSKKSKKIKRDSRPVVEQGPTYSDLIDAMDITVVKTKGVLIKPGIDSFTKYQVCFHCLRKRNKALVLCPRCQYIYYCSEQCNKLNVKLKAQHFCNMSFYKEEKAKLDAEIADTNVQENLETLCKQAMESCGERLRNKQEMEKELKKKQLEEERKKDIYGTRFLKEPKTGNVSTDDNRLTQMTLYGSRSGTEIINIFKTKSLHTRLTNISIFEDKYTNMLLQRHESSLKQLSITITPTTTTATEPLSRVQTESENYCVCEDAELPEKEVAIKTKPQSSTKKNYDKKKEERKTNKEEISSKLEAMEAAKTPNPIVRKMRKIPKKYQYFIEMLSNYFPKQDLPFLFLPYACYSNGHLYYKLDQDVFSRTYSMM